MIVKEKRSEVEGDECPQSILQLSRDDIYHTPPCLVNQLFEGMMHASDQVMTEGRMIAG